MATTYQVGQSSDDCFRRLSDDQWILTHSYQIAGAFSISWQWGGGMRFTNILIPQGATIAGAYLRLRASGGYSGADCNTRISAEDVDNAITFADDRDAFDTRWAARTAARVDWDNIPETLGNTYYNSPSIVSVIQEIVDRGSWVSGNAIAIFWEDFDDRSTHASGNFRDAWTYDNQPTYAPRLIISLTIPSVTTQAVSDISTTTATGNGNITDLGSSSVTQHGVCWNTGGTPTTADSKTEEGAGNTGAFTSSITGLSTNILYYVRAYAINEFGTSYGGEVSFTSLELPTVTTQAVSNIATTTATGNGNVTDLGNPNPTAHGVCWNTTGSPTTADNTTDEGAKGSTGAFTTSMTSLTPNETYYVKAYATNTAGTSYGGEVSFQALGTPTVTTQTMEYVLGTTAVGRGTITVLGNPAPTAHGHVWGESVNPTTSDTTEDNGAASATGTFTSNFSDTVPGTPYYTRAFATNSQGTSYGFNVYFVPPTTGVSGRAGYIWMEGQHFHGFNENAVEITMEDMDNPRILTWLGL